MAEPNLPVDLSGDAECGPKRDARCDVAEAAANAAEALTDSAVDCPADYADTLDAHIVEPPVAAPADKPSEALELLIEAATTLETHGTSDSVDVLGMPRAIAARELARKERSVHPLLGRLRTASERGEGLWFKEDDLGKMAWRAAAPGHRDVPTILIAQGDRLTALHEDRGVAIWSNATGKGAMGANIGRIAVALRPGVFPGLVGEAFRDEVGISLGDAPEEKFSSVQPESIVFTCGRARLEHSVLMPDKDVVARYDASMAVTGDVLKLNGEVLRDGLAFASSFLKKTPQFEPQCQISDGRLLAIDDRSIAAFLAPGVEGLNLSLPHKRWPRTKAALARVGREVEARATSGQLAFLGERGGFAVPAAPPRELCRLERFTEAPLLAEICLTEDALLHGLTMLSLATLPRQPDPMVIMALSGGSENVLRAEIRTERSQVWWAFEMSEAPLEPERLVRWSVQLADLQRAIRAAMPNRWWEAAGPPPVTLQLRTDARKAMLIVKRAWGAAVGLTIVSARILSA